MKPCRAFTASAPGKQAGSILINTVAGLLIGIVLLSVVDLGYIFFYKREYQKSADLAALAGAQQLRSGCAAALTAAGTSATSNLGVRSASQTPQCGTWTPTAVPPATRFTVTNFSPDAVRVIITGAAPSFIRPARNVSASAIATLGDPQASFSVGSRAVRLSTDSALGPVLEGLGLNLSGTSLVSYDGLASVKITPGGLLQQLGIPVAADITAGGLNALLAANTVSLGSLLNAIATVAGQTSLASVNAQLVTAIKSNFEIADPSNPLNVRLGSSSAGPGLFAQIVTPDAETNSALKTQINVLDLVSAAVGLGTSGHALTATAPINLLGLVRVTTKVGVVEPPSIAIGGLGSNGICDSGEVCPTAYSAQVRTYVHVTTEGTGSPLAALLDPLLYLDLPIVIDAVTGSGKLQELCTDRLKSGGQDRAEILVNSSVGKICVGNITAADLFSKSKACDDSLGKMKLLDIAGLLSLPDNRINLSALQATSTTIDLVEGETKITGNELTVGNTVSGLVNELVTNVFGGTPSSGTPTASQLDNLRDKYWSDTASVCTSDTSTCRGARLDAAKAAIDANATSSGLLTGVLNGLTGLLTVVANNCTGVLFIGGSESGCKQMIRDTLSNKSNGSTVSNLAIALTGLIKPVLNALGTSVLTPVLTNVVGLHLGETDVKLMSLSCGGNPKLVD
ncbi:MAG: TadG family pilus assembly protein [Panacagrimonas sp.]